VLRKIFQEAKQLTEHCGIKPFICIFLCLGLYIEHETFS
jgi:hypothetical protein